MGKILKYARILIAAVIMVMVTIMLVTPAGQVVKMTRWIAEIQLFPLALAFSLGWFMLWIAITLVLGRVYCSTVCPLGTLQDIFAALRGKRPYRYAGPMSVLRYLMLAVAVAAAMLGISCVTSLLDPYSDYAHIVRNLAHPMQASALGLLIAMLILVVVAAVSARRGRLLCNTICPVGTALGVVSRYSIFHIDIDTDLCTNCRKCVDVCKAQCINLNDHVVDSSRCVNCFNCLPVCENKAIRYTAQRKQLSIPMMQSLRTGAATACSKPISS